MVTLNILYLLSIITKFNNFEILNNKKLYIIKIEQTIKMIFDNKLSFK